MPSPFAIGAALAVGGAVLSGVSASKENEARVLSARERNRALEEAANINILQANLAARIRQRELSQRLQLFTSRIRVSAGERGISALAAITSAAAQAEEESRDIEFTRFFNELAIEASALAQSVSQVPQQGVGTAAAIGGLQGLQTGLNLQASIDQLQTQEALLDAETNPIPNPAE